ncbi:alpha/beta hydrolase family protein [Pseudomonas sp. UL073]|uniref:Alpha/beta hydrolase family protein n=1 Tax=Zestomonas insulae TaxID=2809017 RepID=A0ABS2IIR7_9GAMM|nr:alpha/beta hydrolase family protein [Pseudomonas insulae]MBM7062219.1 alpha/beta hydrolase family protein [Pseudomonas insulae]
MLSAKRLSTLCLFCLLPFGLPTQAEDAAQPAEPSAAPVERVGGEQSVDTASALQQRLPGEQQLQLQAGEESFLALWQPANVGTPSGVIVLVPGDGESADWPRAIGPLRRKLPDAGWHTLSLTLPDPQGAVPPVHDSPAAATDAASADASAPASEAAETAPASEAAADATAPAGFTAEQREAHAQRVLARIRAGIAAAEERQPKTIVLLGHGSGAYWAARYLAEQPSPRIQNLLLVAAEVPEGFTPTLDSLIPPLKLATGDFFYQDNPGDRRAALQRLQAAKRQQLPAYIQVAMKALPGNVAVEQEQLYRRIKGWLSLHIKAAQRPAG